MEEHKIDCATNAAEVADEFMAMGCTCGADKRNKAEPTAKSSVDCPVMPCALIKIISQDINGDVGKYYLVEDYNNDYYQTVRQDTTKTRFRRNPTLLSKNNCAIILSKA